MTRLKPYLIAFILLFGYKSFGQIEKYRYTQKLTGVADQWHVVRLPEGIFEKINNDLSDIRIYGFNAADTLEMPYILRIKNEVLKTNQVAFELINISQNEAGNYLTFDNKSSNNVNQILLDFEEENFDWKIKLSGSNDQLEWFDILEDYRILSIKNQSTNYSFTKLNFHKSNYRFFRLQVPKFAKLASAKMQEKMLKPGTFQQYNVLSTSISQDSKTKQTIVHIALDKRVPVSQIELSVADDFDYYRPYQINYLSDSVETEKGWKYRYSNAYNGVLSTMEKNEANFSTVMASRFEIIIDNHDNLPLHFEKTVVKGYIHELLTRLSQADEYVLAYGYQNASRPFYDLQHFVSQLPDSIPTLELGTVQEHQIVNSKPTSNSFSLSKIWLWIVMIIIIALLGWFTVKMMKTV